ncbi:MAG: alpha/beta hydrolase [Flavobacteriaceae bacterium]|jgi:pimeloyl-ACP methyl ester carboxylesterase|nr:alpha/beta hydrolase [Flavobacteriaceae bacterium]MDG1921173.1 alpha/beta hydrolase [Flavobacteriaceae bacterium]
MLHHTLYPATNNSKKWITFVHGAGGSSSIWFNQVRFFKSYFNVLLIDLRGHGRSAASPEGTQYTFDKIIEDLIEVLDHNKINKSHFVGISLGSILIQKMLFKYQSRVEKIGLGGAILNLNFQSRVLMFFGNLTQSILPFIWIYTFFAYVIMPYRNHRKSRALFIREAKKLSQNEFKRWYKLTKKILPLLEKIRSYKVKTPVLYIMGKEDYMFLPFVKEMVQAHESSSLITLSDSGHVVNIDQPEQFNNNLLTFLLKD